MRKIRKELFENYIHQYSRLVFSVCLTFTGNNFDAEDLTQETFLSAYESLERFQGDKLKAYLTTIAANKCKDFLRRSERKNIALTEEDAELLEDSRRSPEDSVLEKDSDQRVKALCSRLKEPYKSIALQYFVHNKKLSDVSKDTGQNLKTLQMQLYRAKALLKVLWEEEERCYSIKMDT